MERSGTAGIGRVVLTNREHPLMLRPHGKGLVMITLRPADEVRADTEYFKEISESKLDEEMVNIAVHIIEQKSGHFDPKEVAGDRYQEALRHLVEQKVRGEKPVIPKAAKPAKVINLMDALRRSLEAEGGQARKPATPSNRRATTRHPRGGTPPRGRGLRPRGRTSRLPAAPGVTKMEQQWPARRRRRCQEFRAGSCILLTERKAGIVPLNALCGRRFRRASAGVEPGTRRARHQWLRGRGRARHRCRV